MENRYIDGIGFCYRYPHPAITADCAVFGFDGRKLYVLLIERGVEPYRGQWALPGGFMHIEEDIEHCAVRELREETGLTNVYLSQFHTFSSVNRDPRERVVTIAFLALVRKSDLIKAGDDAAKAVWFEMDNLPRLAFDHAVILKEALNALRLRLATEPIAFKLLDEKFTMPDLQRIYEAINGVEYDRRNFSRKMVSTGLVKEVAGETEGARGVTLWSFDEQGYEEFKNSETQKPRF